MGLWSLHVLEVLIVLSAYWIGFSFGTWSSSFPSICFFLVSLSICLGGDGASEASICGGGLVGGGVQ